jgi:hypothetical protein
LKRMIWAARRDVLEGGRPAQRCGGGAYRDMGVGNERISARYWPGEQICRVCNFEPRNGLRD